MASGNNCSGAGGCPRVFVSPEGEVALQGYGVRVPALVAVPPGERIVKVGLEAWREFNRQVEAAQEDPFTSFTHSAFRLETLPQYLVDVEAGRFQAFRQGRPLPPWPADSVAWFAGISRQVAAGKRWGRVHVVDQPLSDYTRFEMACYEDNVRAGEEVRIAERNDDPELDDLHQDFWLFDAESDLPVALIMRYDPDGRWLGYWRTEDPSVITECCRLRDIAIEASVGLDAYLAMRGLRATA
jgi:hypothetical protein